MKAVIAIAALNLAVPTFALSHSQLFLKARITAVASAGELSEIRTVLRYEPMSAAAIREQFDRDDDGSLDDAERRTIALAVREMRSPFTIRTHLVQNGREVPLKAPSGVRVDVLGRELVIAFSAKPDITARAGGRMALWADDPEHGFVVDFGSDGDLKATGSDFQTCGRRVVRPGTESASRNQAIATDMFFGDPQGRNRPALTSPRLEIDCPG